MRKLFCLFLLLPACATHAVRCDGRLRPINSAPAAAAPAAVRAAPAPAAATRTP